MVENLDDRLGIFGARFPYFECHFRLPFAVLIKGICDRPAAGLSSVSPAFVNAVRTSCINRMLKGFPYGGTLPPP
jgi:hypothetical protein